MKMRSIVVALAAGAVLFPAGAAVAQDMPNLPGLDQAREQVGGATAQSPRVPASDLLPAEARAGLSRGVGGSSSGSGTGSPSRLPETGVDTTALALDGLTLLGAGTLLLTIRRRWAAAS
jgi:LPXTG-motif cell wall-anchored protein